MNNQILKELEASLSKLGTSLKQVEHLYPKINESFMPLSITGVSPRTYFHWKKSGLITHSTSNDEQRSWVRINLIEYVWIKIIQIMRDFGIPLETIKETRDMMFTNILKLINTDKDAIIEFFEKEGSMGTEKIESAKKIFDLISEIKDIPEEFEIYNTIIGSLVCELLIKNDKGSILITKNQGRFDVGYFSFKKIGDFQKIILPLLESPHIQIPIKKLIEDFFDDPKSEKYVDSFELLNLKEKKVIDAIRKKDFKEIIIKQDGKDESIIIEVEKDGAIMDQKAKEVKRILGLNEYSEVTIKFRNDKHLYFKNKTRL